MALAAVVGSPEVTLPDMGGVCADTSDRSVGIARERGRRRTLE